jgi:hypothetical protein
MFGLQPPRHISTLPNPETLTTSKCFPVHPELRTSASVTGMCQKCQCTKSLRDSPLRGVPDCER